MTELKNSTLHVVSRTYSTGGHTRVIERWLEASDESEIHSIATLRQGPIGDRLLSAINARGGNVHRFSGIPFPINKAKWLRNKARAYSRVIFHVHPDEVAHALAFGDKSFPKPTYHYNHADHVFWVGASIADCVLELREWGKALSVAERQVRRTVKIGIPFQPEALTVSDEDRIKAKTRLGFHEWQKLVITVGNSKKYLNVGGSTLAEQVAILISDKPEIHFVAIGPSLNDNPEWRELIDRFPEQVTILSEIPSNLIGDYFKAADLALDSYPLNGATVVWDFLSYGIPCLTMRGVAGHMDEIVSSNFFARSWSKWQEIALNCLSQPSFARENAITIRSDISTKSSPEAWRKVTRDFEDLSALEETEGAIDDYSDQSLRTLNNYLVAMAGWRDRLLL